MSIKRTVGLLLSLLLVLTGLPVLAEEAVFEDTIAWDAEYDVVVVGYGAAGAVTSITASDLGARTLMVEKAEKGEEGGNSRYAAQIILAPTDREKAITYFKAMRGGYDNQSDAVIEAIVDGSMAVREWLTDMGAPSLVDYPLIEYPELPGADGISTVVIDGETWTSRFFALLRDNINARVGSNLDVWYSSPATELIQDPATKIIHGVKVDMQGQMVNVRAKNGVVLACGGFENNEDMIENYTQMQYCYSKGAKYNTGDGIKMAMRVGADLWHMSALSGPDVNFRQPDTDAPTSYAYGIQWPNAGNMFSGIVAHDVIFVGSDGTRFVNESESPRHGHIDNHGTWISMPIPQPAYMIFDEDARANSPIYNSWSEGSLEEIKKGWIKQADTIEELAEIIGVPVEGLTGQIERFNGYCESGEDPIFGRDERYLKAIDNGPFYAMELAPFFTNTQGGPKRDEFTRVLDVDGNPIPHLYSAGELGSYYADIYNGGGNLAECIFSGRTAGAAATEAKNDVSGKSVMENKTPVAPTAQDETVTAAEGELIGVGRGIGGDVVVKVVMDGDAIASVEVVSHNETAGISDRALVDIPAAIVLANAPEVDAVAGATVTSNAIVEAVKDALAE